MFRRARSLAYGGVLLVMLWTPAHLSALDPSKSLTQYTRAAWTQAQGLPQETIRAITQTADGYLWLGTSEGLARFDGYEFTTFTKDQGALPSSSVTALYAGPSGTLWIGTTDGVAAYSGGRFKAFTSREGLPAGTVTSLVEDRSGTLWVVSGGVLSRFAGGRFTAFSKDQLAPLQSVRVAYEDRDGQLWVGGVDGVVKRAGNQFSPVFDRRVLEGTIVTSILKNRTGLWLAGIQGILLARADGRLQRFTARDGLPTTLVRALLQDRDGNVWAGTNGGLSRFQNDRFVAPPLGEREARDWVWSLFEDREGDLWVGMNSALNRLRDDVFTNYGRSEGLPPDDPVVVRQDARGKIWVGYHNSGLIAFSPGASRAYTVHDGLPSNEIFGIRESRNGDLLIDTRGGLSRMHEGRFQNFVVPDPAGRRMVFDALENPRGGIWAATAGGVYESNGKAWRALVPESSSPSGYTVTLALDRDGSLWAGTFIRGLWHIREASSQSASARLYTTADGLGSNQIRSLYRDSEGTLWIGTFGGGLNMFRDGVFHRFTAHDGLLSDNVSHVEDDGRGNLWLSTTRGICRVSKQQLNEFLAGKIKKLSPQNFGVSDGLRSAQCSPGFPIGGGGTRSRDGHLWFPTAGGLATVDPDAPGPGSATPITHIIEMTVDNREVDTIGGARLQPGTGSVQFRYTGIFLKAPELIRYSYTLQGLDRDWIAADSHRTVTFDDLPHGRYRFVVRAVLPGGTWSESQAPFEVLPHFYQTTWFVGCAIGVVFMTIYGAHRLHLRQVHGRFALVLEERARLAREIHDTLAQGFVGIASQLDALAMKLDGDPAVARDHLSLAQKMARHSLTEARRSVNDLRAQELEQRDLPAALAACARRWVAGTSVSIDVKVPEIQSPLPDDLGHNLLRIAQEAVANVLKHARARKIWVDLRLEDRALRLRVKGDGQGFEPSGALSALGGHYGILGMRERAEKLGGEFLLSSRPGSGTEVEVRVPLASRSTVIN